MTPVHTNNKKTSSHKEDVFSRTNNPVGQMYQYSVFIPVKI
jgi:hypothetical protein